MWPSDEDCDWTEHTWGADMPRVGNEYREGESTSVFAGRADKAELRRSFRRDKAECLPASTGGQFCQRCGAWRGELGLEPYPRLYIEHLVAVFREVRRVLRDDGVMWVNIGDSYASGKGTCFNPGGGDESLGQERKAAGVHPLDRGNVSDLRKVGLKPKDLVGIPWMLALALRDDGWYLRRDVVWAKPNPMPESVNGWRWERHKVKAKQGQRAANDFQGGAYGEHRQGPGVASRAQRDAYFDNGEGATQWQDCPGCEKCAANDGLVLRKGSWRPTSSHEYVFFLAKSDCYFGDADAVREENAPGAVERFGKNPAISRDGRKYEGMDGISLAAAASKMPVWSSNGRNLRDVWTIATEATGYSHYATFPRKLVTPCIKAGTSEKGAVPVSM